MAVPRLIEGNLAVDDRGEVGFVNDFDFKKVKRFYTVSNHRKGFVRAWHGHKREAKYVTVVKGAALICAVRIDNWQNPSKKSAISRHTLSGRKPAVFYIPAGYANGFKSLVEGTTLIFFSTSSVEESKGDDFRFDSRYWDPWTVVER